MRVGMNEWMDDSDEGDSKGEGEGVKEGEKEKEKEGEGEGEGEREGGGEGGGEGEGEGEREGEREGEGGGEKQGEGEGREMSGEAEDEGRGGGIGDNTEKGGIGKGDGDGDGSLSSAREKKLHDLRLKMQRSRSLNQKEVMAERRRELNVDSEEGAEEQDSAQNARHQHYKEVKAREKEALTSLGLPEDKAHLLHSQELAERLYKKAEKKPAAFGWDAFNQKTLYTAFQKRADSIPVDLEEYDLAKQADPEFYRDGNSMLYGQAPKIPEKNVNRMVQELEEQKERREKFSRRRKHYEGRDVDSINDRNAHFNRKIGRAFDGYTADIKLNLERGTALPDR